MKVLSFLPASVMITCGVLASGLAKSQAVAQAASATRTSLGSVEEIYIARSLRESRDKPTEFCAKSHSGFDNATVEDHYSFKSVVIRTSDGRLTNNNVKAIGSLHSCFGATDNPNLVNFFAEGAFGSTTFTGHGECLFEKADYPEPGLTPLRCFMHLSDLPTGYVGGELTTNSVKARNVTGEVSDPAGYTQPSIATIRLWKRRNRKIVD